jgi:hypothetical protein
MMTRQEFQSCLSYLGLSTLELSELLSVNQRTTRRWSEDPAEISGPAEQALRAWVRLQRLGLAWRPDGVAIGESNPERVAEQIGLYLRHAIDLDALIQRVENRGGPAAPWEVDLAARRATLGPAMVTFYPLVNGGFSPASYLRRDRAPDIQRDWKLIEDALACVAKAIAIVGSDWARQTDVLSTELEVRGHDTQGSVRAYLDEAGELFADAVKRRADLTAEERKALDFGMHEIALVIQGAVPKHVHNTSFKDLILSANPRYRDWPLFIDTRGFQSVSDQPYVTKNGWQALFMTIGEAPWDLLEFMRLDPMGKFYLKRMLDDDSFARSNKFAVGAYLDPHFAIARTAEAIAVGLAFANAMKCSIETTQLAFGFRWTKLARRQICSWTGSGRFMPRTSYTAIDDEAEGFVEVPLRTPPTAISPFVDKATESLFAQFGGFQIPIGYTNNVVQKRIDKG